MTVSAALRRRSSCAWLFLGLTFGSYAMLIVMHRQLESYVLPVKTVSSLFPALVGVQVLLAIAMFIVNRLSTFRQFFVLHAAISVVSVFLFIYRTEGIFLWGLANIIPACVYEDYPWSVVSAGAVASVLTVAAVILYSLPVEGAAMLLLGMCSVAVTLAAYSRQREGTIRLRHYVDQLEENVTSLTRANYLSQDYAKDVEEASRAQERQQMTRDIHDVVGYTLTNSIMMMEATKVMIRSEPEKVPDFVESIRVNTENGLTEIKRILREIRAREIPRETVFWAIRKLIRVFTLSTRVDVVLETGNVSGRDLDVHAHCVYHFVQEALVNAFRHGRAMRVTIILWDHGSEIVVTVLDNGMGTEAPPHPSIGISGMIERAQSVGGRVVIDNHVGGFEISLFVPKAHDDANETGT